MMGLSFENLHKLFIIIITITNKVIFMKYHLYINKYPLMIIDLFERVCVIIWSGFHVWIFQKLRIKLYSVVLHSLYLNSLSFAKPMFSPEFTYKKLAFYFWNSFVLFCVMFLFNLTWQIWLYCTYGIQVIICFVEIPTDRKLSMQVVMLSRRVKN